MRSEAEVNRALELYADMVRRICFIRLKNYADVEDVFQEVFLKYILHRRPFESNAHEKAWLIRVTVNACKDLIKSFFRTRTRSLEDADVKRFVFTQNDGELLDAVFRLPVKYRDVVYLHYYEGYNAVEIAKILERNENTVYTWLSRARKELRERLGGGADG